MGPSKPRALDLFCGAGGATKGLQRAGFHVTGVDIKPQPNYCGDGTMELDALDALADDTWAGGFDLVWASPPCQRYIRGGLIKKRGPDLVAEVRDMLRAAGVPWVIENVPGAPLRRDLQLCGSMFGLPVRRHRWFEASFPLPLTQPCDHSRPAVGVYGHPHGKRGAWPGMLPGTLETWRGALGIDWMTAAELSQAIPPAYSELIGKAALHHVAAKQERNHG